MSEQPHVVILGGGFAAMTDGKSGEELPGLGAAVRQSGTHAGENIQG